MQALFGHVLAYRMIGNRVNSASQIEEMKYQSVRGEKKPIISDWIISQF